MDGSLFNVMHGAGMTSLRLHYDWKRDLCMLEGAHEWDEGTVFSDYNNRFDAESPLSAQPRRWLDLELRELFRQQRQLDYLESIFDLMRKGRHRLMECFYFRDQGIRMVSNVHNDRLGLNNRRHALRAGGIRRHDLGEREFDVLVDGLNLSRGMSFKNAAARIPYGGAKFTVMADPIELDNLDHVGCLSYGLDRARVFTGPDMGYPPELADVMNEHFTNNIVGGTDGPLGATGPPTAEGVFLAAKACLSQAFGEASCSGRKIAVSGLGAVGMPLAKLFLGEGARLVVADLDPEPIRRLRDEAPRDAVEVLPPEEILEAQVDLFAPCAVGGLLDSAAILRLGSPIVLGAANNVLRASSQAEELQLAHELQARGVLYQVEWAHNMAGVICGAEEYEQQALASMDNVRDRARVACGEGTKLNLVQAAESGLSPTQTAYEAVERQIYGEVPGSE